MTRRRLPTASTVRTVRTVLTGLAGLASLTGLAACGGNPTPPPTPTGASAHPPSVAASGTTSPSLAPHLRILVRRTRLPVALGREAVIAHGHDVIVAGGMVAGDSSTATTYLLDLRHLRTTRLPPMPVPVHDTAGATAGQVPLVIGGGNASEQNVVQAWNGTAWTVIGHLPEARSDLVAVRVDGRIVVLGGYNGGAPAESDILASRTGRSWRTIGTLPVPVRYAATTVADGAIWLFGGERSGAMVPTIQRVDPRTGRATVVGRLPVPTGHAVAIPLGRRILIAGGRIHTENTLTDRMWWFDPATHRVSATGRLPVKLADAAVAQSGSRFFLLGGETPGVSDRIIEVTD